MRRRESPWRWPASVLVALALLVGGVFFTPRAWLAFVFATGRAERPGPSPGARPWLVLLPPPAVEVAPDPIRPRPVPEERTIPPAADWWTRGWQVRIAAAHREQLAPTADDSVHVLLDALGLERDLAARARPDSLIRARLDLLRREDALRFDELKPYLYALARAHAYRHIQARAADMFDDFLRQDIVVTDPPGAAGFADRPK